MNESTVGSERAVSGRERSIAAGRGNPSKLDGDRGARSVRTRHRRNRVTTERHKNCRSFFRGPLRYAIANISSEQARALLSMSRGFTKHTATRSLTPAETAAVVRAFDASLAAGLQRVIERYKAEVAELRRHIAELESKSTSLLADAHTGTWQRGATYRKGQLAMYKGHTILALAETQATPFESPDWRLFAQRGRAGRMRDAG